MSHCKDCRFWAGSDLVTDRVRFCPCNCPHIWRFLPSMDNADKFGDIAICLSKEFYTGPDFGCVHWEEKT